MRLYVKRLLFFGVLAVFLWFLLFYASLIEMPKLIPMQSNTAALEEKILKLERQMDVQLADSRDLLEKVKNHIKNKDGERIGVNRTDAVPSPDNIVIPILVIACDRITVRRCLENLVRFRPNAQRFPIIVSQDCGHNATYNVIRKFVDSDPSISVVLQPDLSEIPLPKAKVKFRGYYKIARHFKFALNYIFRQLKYDTVIIVEDDLDISPDFFEYFLGTYSLLYRDPSLWCISAWNDNGKQEVIDMERPDLLYRTDFFPGLGWMLRSKMWDYLEPKWPPAFFDDWLRNPQNIANKSCIRPEISRTYSFGKIGVSKGLFFDKHLRNIKLNTKYVHFTKMDLDHLIKERYDRELYAYLETLQEITVDELLEVNIPTNFKVYYRDANSFRKNAKQLGLMDDFRSGVPRTAYRGIVTCYLNGNRVFLTPRHWNGYDPSWG